MNIEIRVDGKLLTSPTEVSVYVIGLKTPASRMWIISEGDPKIIRSLGREIVKHGSENNNPPRRVRCV